jgi:dTDP-4-amino-4,6-dideoxygalactose transaminase
LDLERQYRVPLHLLNSARAGLKIALNECRKCHPERKTVVVPAYICNSVPQTITSMGLKVVSAPVNAQLNLCQKALIPFLDENCLAVVMPHMYGVPAAVHTIRQLTRDAGIFLIDDAAQVAGIRVDDQLLGTFGDYGMLSFAQAKSIVCGVRGAGGVVSSLSRLPKYLHFWAQYLARGTWATLDYYVERLRNLFFQERRNYYPDNKTIAESDASIALAQFRSLDRRICFAIQRAEIARRGLSNCSNILAPQFQDIPRYVTRFVIQTRLLDPARLAEGLRKIGIESRRVYGDGSRAYDGSPNSGLLELPWIGLSNPETILMIDRLSLLDPK